MQHIDGQDDFTSIWKNRLHTRVTVTNHFFYKRRNFTGCYTVGEVLLPPVQVLNVVNEGSTAKVPHRIIDRAEIICRFFRGAVYGSENITICDSAVEKFPFITVHITLSSGVSYEIGSRPHHTRHHSQQDR